MKHSMSIAIEAARATDLPDILALLEQGGLPRDGLSDHLATALVARAGDAVVGSAALEFYGNAVRRSLVAWRCCAGKEGTV